MKRFPVLTGEKYGLESVPWEFVAPHERQAQKNHDQSLERLAERGGLSPVELLSVVKGRRIKMSEVIVKDGEAHAAKRIKEEMKSAQLKC